MIRRIDIAFYIAALAFAIASAAGAASAEAEVAPAPMSAIPADLIRNIVETWTRDQVEAAVADEDDGQTRYEVSARWQGDILLDTPGQVEFNVRRLSSRPFRGPTVVRLELHVDGALDRAMTVTVDCRSFRDVVTTTRAVRRGALLDPELLAIEERDITSLKHGSFASLDELSGMRAGRPIGSGVIVSHRHAEPVPVIHRGDGITMSVTSGNMSLLASGEALQDGGVGERIRVRNIDSGKVIYGVIIDADMIRISGS